MKYTVVITDTAWAEVEEAYEWLAARAPSAAQKWKLGLLDAVAHLESMPQACSLAPETDYFGRDVRQLLYGKRQHKYRVLSEIRDAKVIALRVRHSSQRFLGEG
jgi:plasmid stabilization system protein ParE